MTVEGRTPIGKKPEAPRCADCGRLCPRTGPRIIEARYVLCADCAYRRENPRRLG